jgi:hypothetical protein
MPRPLAGMRSGNRGAARPGCPGAVAGKAQKIYFDNFLNLSIIALTFIGQGNAWRPDGVSDAEPATKEEIIQ